MAFLKVAALRLGKRAERVLESFINTKSPFINNKKENCPPYPVFFILYSSNQIGSQKQRSMLGQNFTDPVELEGLSSNNVVAC